MAMQIGIFTSVCEEDIKWIPQYLEEIERTGYRFAMHFDNCSDSTKDLIRNHPQCVGTSSNNNPRHIFSERDKQATLDMLVQKGFDWAINWDIDETWEKDAPEKLKNLDGMVADVVDYKWVCLWDDPQHIRVDGPLRLGHRTRIYNLKVGVNWRFYSDVINGAAAFKDGGMRYRAECRVGKLDVTCVHWGYMTKEDRNIHRLRWDRVYGAHRGNWSEFWNWLCDESITPKVEEHSYFQPSGYTESPISWVDKP